MAREMSDLIQNGLDRAVELMAVAAHNSFRFGHRNTIKLVSLDKEDMNDIAEFCYSLGDMSPLAARDGRFLVELIKEPCALILMGDKRKSDFNYNCGACGYHSCDAMSKAILNGLYRPQQCHHFLEKFYDNRNDAKDVAA
jgi:uncharacterized ferredoxin-like protein